jgi:hypothetical protein
VIRAQHGKVLGDRRLVERQGSLEFLDGPVAFYKELDEPNSDWVREGFEESRLKRLQLPGRGGCGGGHVFHCIAIILYLKE